MRRGAWQLQELELWHCVHGGSSRGARALLQDPSLAAFLEANDHLVFRARVRSPLPPSGRGLPGAACVR